MRKPEKLSANSYRLTVSCGYDQRTGKQVHKRKTVTLDESLSETKREKELIRQYALFEEEVRNGMYSDKGNMPFEKFTQIWLEDYAEVKLRIRQPIGTSHYYSV